MNKPISPLAARYIARKEDFQKAITDLIQLEVIAVYEDGSVVKTYLTKYIVNARRGVNLFTVTTNDAKRDIEIVLI